jgi:hypothetical protein
VQRAVRLPQRDDLRAYTLQHELALGPSCA